jgi:hypothetical protein
MKNIKQITAKEAAAISTTSVDIITKINEAIYESAACGYGRFFMLKTNIPGFYEIENFLERYYMDHGFHFWKGPNNNGFSVSWDENKEEKTYYETTPS